MHPHAGAARFVSAQDREQAEWERVEGMLQDVSTLHRKHQQDEEDEEAEEEEGEEEPCDSSRNRSSSRSWGEGASRGRRGTPLAAGRLQKGLSPKQQRARWQRVTSGVAGSNKGAPAHTALTQSGTSSNSIARRGSSLLARHHPSRLRLHDRAGPMGSFRPPPIITARAYRPAHLSWPILAGNKRGNVRVFRDTALSQDIVQAATKPYLLRYRFP